MSIDSLDSPPGTDAPDAEPLLDINGNPITPGLNAAGDASRPAPPDAEPPAPKPAAKTPAGRPARGPVRAGEGGSRLPQSPRPAAASPSSGYAALPEEEEARFDLAGNPLPPKPANDTSAGPAVRAPVAAPRRPGTLRDPGAEGPPASRGILGLILVLLAIGAVIVAAKFLPARLHPEAQTPAAVSAPATSKTAPPSSAPSNVSGSGPGKAAPASPFH